MREVVIDGVKYTGINDIFPQNIKYFTDFLVNYNLVIGKNDPIIDTITAVSVDINIANVTLIDTTNNLSYEGQYLSGKKILVDFKILFNIKYISAGEYMDICREKIEIYKCISIVVPKKIGNDSIEDLIRRCEFEVNPYIESVICKKLSNNQMRVSSSILMDVQFYN